MGHHVRIGSKPPFSLMSVMKFAVAALLPTDSDATTLLTTESTGRRNNASAPLCNVYMFSYLFQINDPSMDTIKVTIDPEKNLISVHNNGRGIPIEMHSKEKIYIPELIFGHLLSSSNYDDDEKKLTGGRNGYGAKLANIYSTEFTIDTADKNSSQKYVQTWTDNMSKMGKAKITKNGRGEEYTRVSFKPDLKRFGMDSIDEDTVALLKKRVHDLAGTVRDIKVFLNDERIKIKGFKQYVDLYLSSAAEQAAESSGGAAQAKPTMIYEAIGARWEVAFAVSDGTFQQVSFANSISTIKGGTHVALIAEQIAKNLLASIQKKNKAATVKPAQIKNHMWIFVNALIENPTFDSQTKETLTLPASKFGTKPVLSDEFMKKGMLSEYRRMLHAGWLVSTFSPEVCDRRPRSELGEVQG